MDERGEQDDERRNIARRVEELERYCNRQVNVELSLDGIQERIVGIPADAVRFAFLGACINEGVTLEMIECLLDEFPDAAQWSGSNGLSPLHCACLNKRVDPGIVRLLLDRWPESINLRSATGRLPLHFLCSTRCVDMTASLAILDLLLDAAPQSAAELNGNGDLPIHLAIQMGKSHPFCMRLIDAAQASLRVQSGGGWLPIHTACYWGSNVETVKCMIKLYPESIDARDSRGDLPIHHAARCFKHGQVAEIIRYLLTKDPNCASSKTGDQQLLPLHLACETASLKRDASARILFDAHPEAIKIQDGCGRTPRDSARRCGRDALVEFLEAQLVYARKASDSRAMRTPDRNGWLPLHHALRSGARLGAIKLLIAGNRDALHISDNQSAYPLHIACEFSTAGVVNYLLERGAPSVSEPNSSGKLPIHLLWESDRVDRDRVEYVEAVWRLLCARPETVMH